MSKPYVSSIVSKYGDIDKVSLDSARLTDIIERQGMSLLIDVLAESVGRSANRMKLGDIERVQLVKTLVQELEESLLERV